MESQLLLTLLSLSALSALMELDNVYAGQFMLSRPLVVGTVLGLLYGDIRTGVQLGIWTELLLLDQLPVGGYVPPSGGVCAASAFMLAYLCMLPVPFSFFLGLCIGKVYSLMETKLRAWRNFWNPEVERAAVENPDSLNGWMHKSLLLQFFSGFVFIFMSVQVFSLAGAGVWSALPEELRNAVELGYFAVPWIGVAALVFSLYSKGKAVQTHA